ncbi:hypothetical protein FD28_GL000143 [Levilactobacillus hammesii DSM 16381]|uniref:Uncharacterized protein n=1 Tax=Levilactobacillus hammesii DSM 16381 TaxID=1423753 RepID=A0A0R1UXW6_9LACO|nr:hypothetical protein FD28_GL000143 [Levilactobacillus hammesii DSM 16381]
MGYLENGDFETMVFSVQSEGEDRSIGFSRPAHRVPAQIWRTVRRHFSTMLPIETGS